MDNEMMERIGVNPSATFVAESIWLLKMDGQRPTVSAVRCELMEFFCISEAEAQERINDALSDDGVYAEMGVTDPDGELFDPDESEREQWLDDHLTLHLYPERERWITQRLRFVQKDIGPPERSLTNARIAQYIRDLAAEYERSGECIDLTLLVTRMMMKDFDEFASTEDALRAVMNAALDGAILIPVQVEDEI